MRLLKPNWVSHDGKPIFSIDIHPDGTRFATGGQGHDSGKVVIWNMAPVKEEADEKNEKVPKMLCQMDNHLACVNCVRWSNNGKYLASGGDDKLIMVWQTGRYAGGSSSVFGTGGKVVNVEQWRCVCTLRGHSGDILDLAWSPHDNWLASCSIDNSVVIWNALKFPEQTTVLRGHTGMVKGVTWDPMGKYLASQSDDKSLRIWRTMNWQQEASVTEPFSECGGTTHVLRLNWSPDGTYIVSAHAMNNSGPTAQIVEREGWRATMDFVGHRKAVTVVRFNPNILSKRIKRNNDKPQQYSCCAIGSRDRSLSIWLTALKRPLVVTHDLFANSVMDITWSRSGFELLCCSWDGTVAYLDFSREEIGTPLSQEETCLLQERIYGKSVAMATNNTSSQIIESTAMLKLQQQQKEKEQQMALTSPQKTGTPVSNGGTPMKPTKQIETKTKDGRRRITPIFLAPQPDLGESPLPFSSGDQGNPVFSTSKEQSRIVIEKKDDLGALGSPIKFPADKLDASMFSPSPIEAMSSMEVKSKLSNTPGSRDKDSDNDRYKMKGSTPGKRKGDCLDIIKKRPRKDKEGVRSFVSTPALPPNVTEKESRVVYTSSDLHLHVPRAERNFNKQISGGMDDDSAVYLEVANEISVGPTTVHRLACYKGGKKSWENVLSSRINIATGNCHMACVACEDSSLSIFSSNGRRVIPSLSLNSQASHLSCTGHYVMVITSKGSLFVWNMQTVTATIKNESLVPIISGSDVQLETCMLTEQGLPVVTLTNGKSHTFKTDMGCWILLSSRNDHLHLCSDHHSCFPAKEPSQPKGPLSTLQANKHRAGHQASRLMTTNHSLQQSCSLSHLEHQLVTSLALKSSKEYHFWLLTYVRYLVQEDVESKLREVFDDLLGPVYKTKQSKWESHILGLSKRTLLEEVLPLTATNLRLQRLFTEYQEQLDSVKT